MTDTDRERAKELLVELRAQAIAAPTSDADRFGLIAKMLLTYPIANASSESGKARGEAYREALSDIPPVVLHEAIKRWNRGEAGQEHDYRWAPAPAVIRKICLRVTEPLHDAIRDLETLLSAVSIDEAMDPKPTPAENAVALRRFG